MSFSNSVDFHKCLLQWLLWSYEPALGFYINLLYLISQVKASHVTQMFIVISTKHVVHSEMKKLSSRTMVQEQKNREHKEQKQNITKPWVQCSQEEQ